MQTPRPAQPNAQAGTQPGTLPHRLLDRDALTGAALGFAAGFVNAAGFVTLAGLFTSHVTGNLVLLGAELVGNRSGLVAKTLALPVFILGVVGTRLAALALERAGIAPLRPLLLVQVALLAALLAVGIALSPLGSPDTAGSIFAGLLGVGAMSVQTTFMRLALPNLPATTAMTTNITQVVIDAVDLVRTLPPEVAGRTAARLRRMLPAVLAFTAGTLAGVFGAAAGSFWCLLAPIAALLGVAAVVGGPTDEPGRRGEP